MMTLFPEWHSLGNLQEGKNDCFTYHMEKNYDLSKTLMWYCALMTMPISMKKAIQTTASNLQQTALDKTVTPFCTSHGPSTLFFPFTSTSHVIQRIFDNSEEHIHFLQSSQDPLGKLVPMLILHTFEHNVWINIWENLSPHTGTFFFLKRIDVKAGSAKFRMGILSRKWMLCFSFPISSLTQLINLQSYVNTHCQGQYDWGKRFQ